jgi:hypothetical protein
LRWRNESGRQLRYSCSLILSSENMREPAVMPEKSDNDSTLLPMLIVGLVLIVVGAIAVMMFV